MSKHTPGPWTLHGEPESIRIEGPCSGSSHLVLIERVGGRRRGEGYSDLSELVANAKLIAAAPDLLEALQAARDLWGDYLPPGNSNAMKAMRLVDSAIAKATA